MVNHVRKNPDVRDRRRRGVVPRGGRRRARDQGPPRGREIGAKGCAWPAASPRTAACASGSLDVCHEDGLHAFLPSRSMCTDNAAMIAAAGWYRLQSDGPSPLDTGADPNLGLPLL